MKLKDRRYKRENMRDGNRWVAAEYDMKEGGVASGCDAAIADLSCVSA